MSGQHEDHSRVLKHVAQNGLALRDASFELRGNREVVMTAVAQHGWLCNMP